MINSFKDEYSFLSNYYPCEIRFNGIVYDSAEAAYQAQKCKNPKDRLQFKGLCADDSKKLGRKVEIREDWEDVKEKIMYDIVEAKFYQNPELAQKLLATGNAYLMEGNYWRDQFWGVYPETGNVGEDGLNVLGQILMRVRANLKYREAYKDESDLYIG